MNESALRPIALTIRISGTGSYNGTTSPFPHVYISDALSQNILYHCYEQSKTVEELAKICGVPAYYVEERLENLLKREAVSEPVKGKYRTEFMIYSDKVNEYGAKAQDIFATVVEDMMEAIGHLTAEVGKLGVYTAERSEEELMYLFGIMALEHLSKKHNPVEHKECPVRYAEAVRKYLIGYKKLFPAHLEAEVDRACEYMFPTLFATGLCKMANERGLLALPPAGSICDVLVQYKELLKNFGEAS